MNTETVIDHIRTHKRRLHMLGEKEELSHFAQRLAHMQQDIWHALSDIKSDR